MALFNWSKTSNANAMADPTINWQTGMAPSAVSPSARAMMSSIAAYRDDVAGGTVTTGAPQAFALSTFSNFTSAAALANQLVAFTVHVTNGIGPVTLTVDSVPNVPLRSAPGQELLAGVLVQGTSYCAVFNQADGAFYLQNFYGASPFLVPIGASLEFWGTTTPNSSFAFMFGQGLSRTAFAKLFALFGTTYGVGDGSTTFNIPDVRGRVVAGSDIMGGTGAGRISGAVFNNLSPGGVGGVESVTLIEGQIPTGIPVSVTGTFSGNSTQTGGGFVLANGVASSPGGGSAGSLQDPTNFASTIPVAGTITGSGTANGGGAAHPNIQPTILANRILRIL